MSGRASRLPGQQLSSRILDRAFFLLVGVALLRYASLAEPTPDPRLERREALAAMVSTIQRSPRFSWERCNPMPLALKLAARIRSTQPGQDAGIDLGREYELAKGMAGREA